MSARTALCGVCALAVAVGVCATSEGRPPALDTILPLGLGDAADQTPAVMADVLRTARDKSGIRRYVFHGPGHFVRQFGALDVDGYRRFGRRIRAIKDLVAPDGIEVGYVMGPTVNVGVNHPWRKFMYADGSERAFTACPGDERFRQAFAAQCAAVAEECRPFLYMIEDDFRYFSCGCFCDEHVRRFSGLIGRGWTRETLSVALKDPKENELRARWQAFQVKDLADLASAASAAIGRASPESRIGLSAPGGLAEDATAAIARALAGPRKPFVRWWGAVYGYDRPLDVSDILFSARWAKENVSDGIECVYEADPCPRLPFYASGARMTGLCSTVLAMGYDDLWYWGAGSEVKSIAACPTYLYEYRRNSKRFAAIRAAAREGRMVGVSVGYDPRLRTRTFCGLSTPDRRIDCPAAARLLNRMGIPFTTRNGAVVFWSGAQAFDEMSDEEIRRLLAGRVFLDGAAAEALSERGFSDLTGVRATATKTVDFTGECVVSTGELIVSTFHQNYGLDSSRVADLALAGAEETSFYYNTATNRRVRSSMTRFRNRAGGRVAVLAAHLAGCQSPNVYNPVKREMIVEALEWLGGEEALPVRVRDAANVMVVAREDASGRRLLVHALNMSCDPCGSVSFAFSPAWRNGSVEILDASNWTPAEVTWKGACMAVTSPEPLQVYGTLVFRVTRATDEAAAVQEERTLPAWRPGELELHFISTGVGENAFYRFPDGTTWVNDCGDYVSDPLEVAPVPSDRRLGGEWVARYLRRIGVGPKIDYLTISHAHTDHAGDPGQRTIRAADGRRVCGAALLMEHFDFAVFSDCDWPATNVYRLADGSYWMMRKAADVAARTKGLKIVPCRVGACDQFGLRHDPEGRYAGQFHVRNLCSNARAWTGKDEEVRDFGAGEDKIGPNPLSMGFRIDYGAFSFYTGGDVSGRLKGEDYEAFVAQACGPVSVAKTNHHSSPDAMGSATVRALRPKAWVSAVWHKLDITDTVMNRMLSGELYPGPRRYFPTAVAQTSRALTRNCAWWKDVARPGHVVVKVAPGGASWRVYVLDCTDERMRVVENWSVCE